MLRGVSVMIGGQEMTVQFGRVSVTTSAITATGLRALTVMNALRTPALITTDTVFVTRTGTEHAALTSSESAMGTASPLEPISAVRDHQVVTVLSVTPMPTETKTDSVSVRITGMVMTALSTLENVNHVAKAAMVQRTMTVKSVLSILLMVIYIPLAHAFVTLTGLDQTAASGRESASQLV